jgi:hypothetical protein
MEPYSPRRLNIRPWAERRIRCRHNRPPHLDIEPNSSDDVEVAVLSAGPRKPDGYLAVGAAPTMGTQIGDTHCIPAAQSAADWHGNEHFCRAVLHLCVKHCASLVHGVPDGLGFMFPVVATVGCGCGYGCAVGCAVGYVGATVGCGCA